MFQNKGIKEHSFQLEMKHNNDDEKLQMSLMFTFCLWEFSTCTSKGRTNGRPTSTNASVQPLLGDRGASPLWSAATTGSRSANQSSARPPGQEVVWVPVRCPVVESRVLAPSDTSVLQLLQTEQLFTRTFTRL